MFETPRTGLRIQDRLGFAAPHREAERDRGCIKLTGIRSGAADLNFLHRLQQTLL